MGLDYEQAVARIAYVVLEAICPRGVRVQCPSTQRHSPFCLLSVLSSTQPGPVLSVFRNIRQADCYFGGLKMFMKLQNLNSLNQTAPIQRSRNQLANVV